MKHVTMYRGIQIDFIDGHWIPIVDKGVRRRKFKEIVHWLHNEWLFKEDLTTPKKIPLPIITRN